MSGAGSPGNILAALCSFILPGLGQLIQGRLVPGAIHFVAGSALWCLTGGFLGWVVNIYSAYEAAVNRS